jgi:hypothetical protein
MKAKTDAKLACFTTSLNRSRKRNATMTNKEKSKARKLFNMFSDNATTDNEKEVAKNKLSDLLKKHKASLSDFVKDLSEDNANLFDFSEKAKTEIERNYKLSDNTLKKSNNKKSRRAIVIDLLKSNESYTKNEIARILTETHKIADFKQNKKCVSGTMYDLQSHNKASFKIDSETEKITAVFA